MFKERGIRISMSRTGHPYDNVQAESVIKTLKYEEVYVFEHQNNGKDLYCTTVRR